MPVLIKCTDRLRKMFTTFYRVLNSYLLAEQIKLDSSIIYTEQQISMYVGFKKYLI